jgi:hypothetical protein
MGVRINKSARRNDFPIIIDITNTEALSVRKNADGGDILIVDTTNGYIEVANAGIRFTSTPATGIQTDGNHKIQLVSNGDEVFRAYNVATAGFTRIAVWDNDAGSLQNVTVGADDSGGGGYKVLRIPN